MILNELIKQLSEFSDAGLGDLDVVIWDRIDDNSNIAWIEESGAKGEDAELVIVTDMYVHDNKKEVI